MSTSEQDCKGRTHWCYSKYDIIHCRDCVKACWGTPLGTCGGHYAGPITPDFFCGEAELMDGV